MEEGFNNGAESILKEERIKNIMYLRKIRLNQKIFKARQRKFNLEALNKTNELTEQKLKEQSKENKKKLILKFKEENYFIDPDDIIMNEKLNQMKFMTTKDIVNNIIELLNDKSDLNSLLFGVLMMRKFSVIEAVLINKTKEFIENKLYMPILNILNAYYNINQKLTFECLWILSSLVYDSQDKNMYHCLLGDKCIDLYKKIILFYSENQFDNNIMKVMSIFILDILIFKQKEMENENNIINCDLNDDFLLDFLNCFVDLIITIDITEEIYISLFIEITNCFSLQTLLKNDLLNKIIISLIEKTIVNLGKRQFYYDDEVSRYYEKDNLNTKTKINSIYQIILIQLQYFLAHPLEDMPSNNFKKLSEEIINKTEKIKEDPKHISYYVDYINSYIYYLIELNLPLSYEEIKKIFDFLIYFLKNKSKNRIIVVACLEGLNNLSTKMSLNKMIGFLISEIPYILSFTKIENKVSIQVINEVFELLITLLIKLGIKIHNEIEAEIFSDIINYLKEFYNLEINNDIKKLLENGYIIISKIIERNEKIEIKNNYKFLIETKGIKDIICNLIINSKIGIPIYLLHFLEINI